MTTAVDTSVLIDVITDDKLHAAASVEALRRARREGRLIACECVVAETRPALQSNTELTQMLDDLGIEFVPGSRTAAGLAGQHFARYLERGGTARRMVPRLSCGRPCPGTRRPVVGSRSAPGSPPWWACRTTPN